MKRKCATYHSSYTHNAQIDTSSGKTSWDHLVGTSLPLTDNHLRGMCAFPWSYFLCLSLITFLWMENTYSYFGKQIVFRFQQLGVFICLLACVALLSISLLDLGHSASKRDWVGEGSKCRLSPCSALQLVSSWAHLWAGLTVSDPSVSSPPHKESQIKSKVQFLPMNSELHMKEMLNNSLFPFSIWLSPWSQDPGWSCPDQCTGLQDSSPFPLFLLLHLSSAGLAFLKYPSTPVLCSNTSHGSHFLSGKKKKKNHCNFSFSPHLPHENWQLCLSQFRAHNAFPRADRV